MNKKSGFYKNGKSHAEGGIPVLVDGNTPIEVELREYKLCNNAMNSTKTFEFKDKTNKEILDDIFQYANCEFEQNKANSGDFIICKLAVMDKNKRNITGTVKEIINVMQSEKSCNVTNDSKEFKDGGFTGKPNLIYIGEVGSSNVDESKKIDWGKNEFDEKQRFEISDENLEIIADLDDILKDILKYEKIVTIPLYSFISHPVLFDAYPEFKNIPVNFVYTKNKVKSLIRPDYQNNKIYFLFNIQQLENEKKGAEHLYTNGNGQSIRRNKRYGLYLPQVAHELEHIVQIREVFGGGSSSISEQNRILRENGIDPETATKAQRNAIMVDAFDAYANKSGEIESKDVEKRLNLTLEERKKIKPFALINIDKSKVNVLFPKKIDWENFKQGGEVNDETYTKWKNLVNMSKSELENFYNSKDGKEAGLSSSEASEQGISSGRESARWIMKMKDTPKSEWTPTMWKWANKQISFISRMSGMKGDLYDDKGNKTRKHTSLLIWGHNPKKYKDGGVLEKRNLTYIGEVGGHNLDIDKNSGFINVYDGKKRYELSDNDIALLLDFDDAKNHCLNNKNTVFTTTIDKVIKHDLLFKAYPQIKDIKFSFYYNENKKQYATYYQDENKILYNFYGEEIYLRGRDTSRRTRLQVDSELRAKVLLHEIQHFIQRIEAMAKGSSIFRELRELCGFDNRCNRMEDVPIDLQNLYLGEATRRYNMSAGELEANDTMNRINLTDEERKQIKSFGLDKDDDVIVKLKDGGELNANEDCAKYIKENENVFKNGYYSFVKNMSIYADSYGGKIPKIDSLIIISYNSGGQNNLKVTDTINPVVLQKQIGELIEEESGIPKIIISKHLTSSKRVSENIYDIIKNNNVIIIDRDEVVCSNLINKLKNGGELKTKEMENKIPKNNVTLYTKLKGDKTFKATDLNGNQVANLLRAPLIKPERYLDFKNAIEETAKENPDVYFRIVEFGTNKVWYDSELNKGIEIESEHKETAEKLYNQEITPDQAAESIAKEHLAESPKYYKELEKMESKLKTGNEDILKIALKDVISVNKYANLDYTEAKILYSLNPKKLNEDDNWYYDSITQKDEVLKSLYNMNYVTDDTENGKYDLSELGKDFIKSVDARIETLNSVEQGLDLFPQEANILEHKDDKLYSDIKSCLISEGEDDTSYIFEGKEFINATSGHNERWKFVSFFKYGAVIEHIAKNRLTTKKENIKITFDEIKKMYEDGDISIDGINNLSTLNNCLKLLSKCIDIIDANDAMKSEVESHNATKKELKNYKKEQEEKAKKERENKTLADDLTFLNNNVLDSLGIESNKELYSNKDLQYKYKEAMDKFMFTAIPSDKLPLDKEVHDILEDENEHLLNQYLYLSGIFGEKEKTKWIEFLNKVKPEYKDSYLDKDVYEPKTEIKEQSNEQKEFKEAINTFEELIKLGGTDAEIKEFQEAIETFKMLLDEEPTKYAKGGNVEKQHSDLEKEIMESQFGNLD